MEKRIVSNFARVYLKTGYCEGIAAKSRKENFYNLVVKLTQSLVFLRFASVTFFRKLNIAGSIHNNRRHLAVCQEVSSVRWCFV